MIITLKYLKKFTPQNTNFVVFVSKISELNTLNLPFNLKNQTISKDFVNRLKNENFLIMSFVDLDTKIFYYIRIYLLKKPFLLAEEMGAKIFENTNIETLKNLNFVFSTSLAVNYSKFISDIVLGFLLKSYIFQKYKEINYKINNKLFLNLFNYKQSNHLIYNYNLFLAINYTKNLVSEPANILNPISYANQCLTLKKYGLKVKILDLNQLETIGMTSLLSVSKGSGNDPRVVIFEWNLKHNIKPTILVGKGVTFDTGGISIKPASGMEEMITDMSGSAVVVGSMMNAALNKSNHSIVGIIGLVENMPDGKSQRPGDIINSLSGQTIEVLNTDAEGRLVLADIITYIQNKYQPKQIVDFATLTGAIMIALGTHRAGLFSNNNKLSDQLFKAGEISGEKIWRLPLDDEYNQEINSSRADMKNIGTTRYGGSIQAAHFIQRFVKKSIPWAHIDIAGVSWTMKSGQNSFSKLHKPGATAFGVRLIDHFLKGR